MPISYEYQVDHLTSALAAARGVISKPADLLEGLGDSLLRVNDERHDAGLAPDGTHWTPLAPSTLQTKRKPKLLYEHGDMLRFYFQVEGGDTLSLKTNDWKAVFHHFGTDPYDIRPRVAKALCFAGVCRKRVHHPGLPERQLVGFPDADAAMVADLTADYFDMIFGRT